MLLVVVLALGLSLGVAASSLAAAHGQSARGTAPRAETPSEVTLTPSPGGVQVTMAPVGLSLEYPVMAQDLGTGPCPPPALAAELLRLGSPPLALGGESQDMTEPGEAATGPPPSWDSATLYGLPSGFWSQLHCLLSATPDPLTVGLNMKTAQPSWAAQMVAGSQSAATAGLSFSLGNEPDLYYLPNYSSLGKPAGAEEAGAVNLYLQLAASLHQAAGGSAPLVGPELANAAHWQRALPRVIAALHETTVGVHMYPLTACGSPRAVTVGGLLSATAADAPSRLSWVVADANAAHVPAIISEANSVSCGGEAGVSDSPAAAVWAVRFVLSALKSGFREVRFHFSGGPYDPFIVRREEVLDRPLESALVALNQWLPVGASLQTIAGVQGLVATRLVTSAGAGRLILDNERAHSQAVVLRKVHSIRIEALSATRAGAQTTTLSSPRGRIKLVVAANTVLAVSSVA